MSIKKFFHLLIFVGVFIFSSCKFQTARIQARIYDESHPIEEGFDVTYYYSDSAVVRAKVTAPYVARYQTGGKLRTEFPKGIHLIFYHRGEKKNSELTARFAVIYDQTRDMEARDSVFVRNEKGETLETEEVQWIYRKQKIYSDAFVKIRTKNEILFGNGFESNQDFTAYKIFKPTGKISLENQETPDANSQEQ